MQTVTQLERRMQTLAKRIEDVESIKAAALETAGGRGLTAATSASNQLNKLHAELDAVKDARERLLESDEPESDEEVVAEAVSDLVELARRAPPLFDRIMAGLVDAGLARDIHRTVPPPLRVVG